jgi:hypothetical protein
MLTFCSHAKVFYSHHIDYTHVALPKAGMQPKTLLYFYFSLPEVTLMDKSALRQACAIFALFLKVGK